MQKSKYIQQSINRTFHVGHFFFYYSYAIVEYKRNAECQTEAKNSTPYKLNTNDESKI